MLIYAAACRLHREHLPHTRKILSKSAADRKCQLGEQILVLHSGAAVLFSHSYHVISLKGSNLLFEEPIININ